MLDIIIKYWPRLLIGASYALSNTFISQRGESRKRCLPRFLLLFVLSGPVVAIVTEELIDYTFSEFFTAAWLSDPESQVGIGFQMTIRLVSDAISCIFPIYVFSKIIKRDMTVAATGYLVYAIFDRFCMVVAVSTLSYFLSMVAVIMIAAVIVKGEHMYVMDNLDSIQWTPVLHYQLGMFFLLDSLHKAAYVFPGVVDGQFDIRNIWVDFIAVISMVFFLGFARMNVRSTQVQYEKMEYMQELQDNQRDIIQKFAEFSEAKSGETGLHIRRVAEYSAILAKECGLSDEEVDHIRIAAMMHDFGKLLVPREILEKPGPLTEEEREIMCKHTVYGNEILSNSKGEIILMARDIAYEHHERWDGKGYPRGLKGYDISIYAQIVSVVDVYDALTSKRAYKEAWDRNKAKNEILSQRGAQFSPRIVDAFIKSFDKISKIQDMYVDE